MPFLCNARTAFDYIAIYETSLLCICNSQQSKNYNRPVRPINRQMDVELRVWTQKEALTFKRDRQMVKITCADQVRVSFSFPIFCCRFCCNSSALRRLRNLIRPPSYRCNKRTLTVTHESRSVTRPEREELESELAIYYKHDRICRSNKSSPRSAQ